MACGGNSCYFGFGLSLLILGFVIDVIGVASPYWILGEAGGKRHIWDCGRYAVPDQLTLIQLPNVSTLLRSQVQLLKQFKVLKIAYYRSR